MSSLEREPAWDLTALTPEFIETEHAQYAKAIADNLQKDDVLNIALSGNYGVGKSSILRRVSDDHKGRVVELSLSTLSPIEASTLDESIPVQATTPTNRIQQEIVKQLLYREEPKSARASRFRRIERFSWGREVALALIGGAVISLAFMILGWAGKIERTLQPLVELKLWVYPILALLAAGGIIATRALLHGRIHIRQFSAGPAAVTLDEKSVSYFDQYLDEIVYFFETSKRDIVLFEDIDRFNDSHIFETLRSLNALLNASPQIKKPIRFIYAIKDSIFDRISLEHEQRRLDVALVEIADPAQAEIVRSNRTKFFDLVIPVVPFITHRSARNLTTQILRGIEHDVSPDLIDLAGRFVPDMRLLKNVRNEFVVFRDRIFAGDGKQLELSETRLFAMMLYKSTHLSDFEVIRLGKSKLDKLYEVSRTLVSVNIGRVERELRSARAEISRRTTAKQRASRLGKILVSRIDLMIRAASYQKLNGYYLLGGQSAEPINFESVEFWRKLADDEHDLTAGWRNPHYSRQQIELGRSDISTLVGDSLDVDAWREAEDEAESEQVRDLQEQLAFLRTSDMGDLMRRPEFLVEFENVSQPLNAVAEKLLTKGLAFDLIRAGYVDRNFTLYTSTFHGDRVSPAATNFIIHHVERGLMDEQFVLTAQDAEAVIRERGARSLAESPLFNIAILDYLLDLNSPDANIMITALARFDADSKRFLQSYLSSGASRQPLVEKLTARSPRVLNYLVADVDLDDDTRTELVSACLGSLATKPKQTVTEKAKAYLAANYAQLPAIASAALPAARAERVALLFKEAGLSLPDLSETSGAVRPAFVKLGLYEMSLSNLQAAVGDVVGVSLDELRAAHRADVYAKALADLPSYLDAVDGHAATNHTADRFHTVVSEVHDAAPELLDRFIAGVSDESQIADVEDVPDETWPVLAAHEKFPVTFSNVTKYIERFGGADADLAVVLASAEKITEHENADEDAKRRLAVTLIATPLTLSAELRAKLAESLGLKAWIVATDLPVESGALYPELVARRVISGNAVTYLHLASANWATRERVAAVSTKFAEWVTPELIGTDLASALTSSSVSDEAKRAIIENADAYASLGGRAGLIELGKAARRLQILISFSVVEQMATHRVGDEAVLHHLVPYLTTASDAQLFGVLNGMGGAYGSLTRLGRDKPRVANTADNHRLLESLKQRGIVTKVEDDRNPMKVHKRYGS
ncbi:P-loop NTPase fold protein [Curtobacterium sp. MCBD17_021]|uniref:YobI family P-loop NTPase n=1 Tax=Curtobacterium sp. MCBD17_021 TaxID=2175665 RepID=UPI000DA7999D|nr:P-loop NTPase fold protein [Curtobacterium sp. MCBD17_021]PZE68757.1 DNA-binding protein [Curtobacterium sp. MCBD17_021]